MLDRLENPFLSDWSIELSVNGIAALFRFLRHRLRRLMCGAFVELLEVLYAVPVALFACSWCVVFDPPEGMPWLSTGASVVLIASDRGFPVSVVQHS